MINIEYSEIGFYYKKNNVYMATIIQILPIYDKFIKEVIITDYIKSTHIDEFSFKSLKKSQHRDIAAIIEGTRILSDSNGTKKDNLKDNLRDIKGIEKDIKGSFLVSSVGSFSVPSGTEKDNLKDIVIKNFFNKQIIAFQIFNTILSKIDSTLILDPNNIKQFLYDSNCFELEQTLNLNQNSFKEDHQNQVYLSHREILNNDEIFNKILSFSSFGNSRNSENSVNEAYVSNFLNSMKLLYETIFKGLKIKKIKAKEFNDIITLVHRDYTKLFGTSDNFSGVYLDTDISIISEDKNKSIYSNNIKILLTNIQSKMLAKEIPIIRLNKLITNFNSLLQLLESTFIPINLIEGDVSSYGLIVTNDTANPGIPIQLKNGNKLLIPMNETNYSRFTKEQLEEMLVLLDIYSTGNNKFDSTRALMTKELAQKNRK